MVASFAAMEFRILGPLEVVDDGRTVDVGAGKQRTLLVALLLDANRVVSADHLIAAIWGETAPETAMKALHVYVSQLRKALGRERIVTRAPGYELRVEPGELDLDRFERLVSDGNLDDALRLWRGNPLADFAYEPFAQSEIARLDELRLASVEERIERDLAQGRHGVLVGELEALVREHPFRERLRGQLMLALYRSGRQAEALETYQAGRALLSDELGLEPDTKLKELQRAILAHEPSLASPVPGEVESSEPLVLPPGGPEGDPPRVSSREVRKIVTVLLCDVAATDARLDPESLRHMELLGLDELVQVLERHGATVERSIGGAVTAIFGIPMVYEDDAFRAVRAAVEMRDRLDALRDELERRWGTSLALRAGIGTGEVLAGGEGHSSLATGAPVQVAMALHRAAGDGELLLDRSTYRLVRDAVDAELLGDGARLLAVHRSHTGYASRFDSPMVGRERERRRLRDAFEQAVADSSCQLFTILGAPGVGKSRLVQEFVGEIASYALVARGRCLPYGEGITYWPVLEAVRDATGLDDAEPTELSRRKLAALLEGDEHAELALERLSAVIGFTDEPVAVDEALWAVRAFFEALSRRYTVVLVFDDIHWGEPTFLDLVDHLSDSVRGVPLLLVCMARPELLDVRPGWAGGKLNATTILLEPLSRDESVELVDNLAGSDTLDEVAKRKIVEGAEGNPFFVEEMLALLREDGGDGVPEDVPPTIQALLAARLDRLGDDERAAIEAASVEGKIFHDGSVAELLGTSALVAAASLSSLVRKELVRPDRAVFSGEGAFRFRHLLIRDAAYESLPKEARASFHERHARWLERKAGDRALEFEEILGYHLERAFAYRSALGPVGDTERELGRRAAERLGSAGRRAFMRTDVSAAVNLISRAAAMLAPDDPARVNLIPNVRAAQGMAGDLTWAEEILAAAQDAGEPRGRAHALVQRGFLRLFSEPDVRPDELMRLANEARAAFEELGDELGLARSWRLVAQTHYLARAAGACAEASEQALLHARRAGDAFEVKEIVEWLAVALALGPARAPDARRRCGELLDDIAGDRFLGVTLLSVCAFLETMGGSTAEADELMARARAVVGEDATALHRIAYYSIYAGLIALLTGELEGARRDLELTAHALEEVGERTNYSSVTAELAHVLCAQGRYEEAETSAAASERAARPNDVLATVLGRSARGKVLARKRDFHAGVAVALSAVEFASESDFLNSHGEALLDLAEVLELAGRPTEAGPYVEQAVALFEQKGNVVSAARGRAELERLGAFT